MKKIYIYMVCTFIFAIIFGTKVEASEISTIQAVLYTNKNTVVYAEADLAEKVILPTIQEGLPVKVTGITNNGFFQVDIAGTYYIPGYGLDATVAVKRTVKQDQVDLSDTVIESKNTYNDYINEVIQLVNMQRQKVGLNPLEYDEDLTYAATRRSVENAYYNNFSHTRPNGTSCLTIFKEYNRQNYRRAGENIAMRQKSPLEVVQDWMESPGHKKNILGNYTKIGVGVAIDGNGQLYWTQLFYA